MRIIGGTSAFAISAALSLASHPAFAQQSGGVTDTETRPASAANGDARNDDEDVIIVTGTSIRGISPVGSSAVTISRDDLADSGHSNPVDVLRELPQIQGLGYDETPKIAQNGFGNLQRGSTINIRGIGSNATLLLIDGRRIAPTGNVFSFTEANQLPVAAIERIEVIADGASAIYGSDAVAGVVNYIPRRRFSGVEVQARGTLSDGYSGWGGSIVTGMDWESGGFVVAYDHDYRSEMRSGESPYLRQDLRPLGGPDTRINGSFSVSSAAPGNILVPRGSVNPVYPTAGNFDIYGVNPGNSGMLTVDDLTLNSANLVDTSDYSTFLPKTTRNQISLVGEQELASWLKFSMIAYYNRRESTLNGFPRARGGVFTLPASSPFYISDIPGVAPGAPLAVAVSNLKDARTTESYATDQSYQGAFNLTADITEQWRADVGVNLSRGRNCANCVPEFSTNVDLFALQAAINSGAYNPFSSEPADEAVLQQILPSGFDRNRSNLDQYTMRLDGPLFALPGGEVKLALGAEYLELTQFRTAIGIKATSDVPSAFASRNIKAAYAELYLPIVGFDNAMPLIEELSLDLAIRTEDYSDAGSTTNPKIGVSWTITDGLKLRGAWGTSFRAPNLIENNPQFFSRVGTISVNNFSGDPAIGLTNPSTNQTTVLNVAGSSAALVPETATNYSFGLDFEPAIAPGLRASLTYYNIHYKDQIIGLQSFLSQFLATPENRAFYAPYIEPAIQPATCVNGDRSTYNPAYLPALELPTVSPISEADLCSSRAILYSRNANASDVQQDGLDFQLTYPFDAGNSSFLFSTSFTKILTNDVQVVAGGATIDGRDIINYPVSFRGRASMRWALGGLSVTPTVNYVGSYTNDLPIVIDGIRQDPSKVPAWTTVDLAVSYDFDGMAGWSDDLVVTANIRNLFDANPPLVFSANGNGMDSQNANPFGTIANLTVIKRF